MTFKWVIVPLKTLLRPLIMKVTLKVRGCQDKILETLI